MCEFRRLLIWRKARGLKGPLGCLTQARYGIAWGAIGAARSCFHCALDYTKSRKQFSRPLAGYQLVAGEAGEDADRNHQGLRWFACDSRI